MKKHIALLLAAVLLLISVVNAAAEPVLISQETYEKIRKADSVIWVGGMSVLLKHGEEGSLTDLRNGKTLLTGVESISRCGNETIAFTQEGIWLVNEECDPEPFPFKTEGSVLPECRVFADGWIAGINDTCYFFWNEKTRCGSTNHQKPDARIEHCETWTDPATGRSVLLFTGNGVSEAYGESGELLSRLEWMYSPVDNGHLNQITNGRIMGYRKQDGCAVIRDVLSGRDIKVFESGWDWRPYDGQRQIFEDGTSLMDCYDRSEAAIVDLDGRELIRTSENINDRFASDFYKLNEEYSNETDSYYYWDQNTCEIFKVVETYTDGELKSAEKVRVESGKEIPGIVYDPEIADGTAAGKYAVLYQGIDVDWQESGILIHSQDGTLLGGQPWSEIWHMHDGDGVSYSSGQTFVMNGFLPVKNEENKWGVLAPDGHMILPAEYDELVSSDLGLDYTQDHIGFVAWKDNEVMIFDLDGKPVFQIME